MYPPLGFSLQDPIWCFDILCSPVPFEKRQGVQLPAPRGYEKRGTARQSSVTTTACCDHGHSPCSREEEELHVTPNFFIPIRVSLSQQKPTEEIEILEKKKTKTQLM